MKKLNSLNLGKGLSRSEMKNVFGGTINYLDPGDDGAGGRAGHKCCKNGSCGSCAWGSGIPTCSVGYTLTDCTMPS